MVLKSPPVVRFGNVRSSADVDAGGADHAALVRRAVGEVLARGDNVRSTSAASLRELIAQNIARALRSRGPER